jgi:XTP/dITP diphosphohydrolase
MAPIRLPEKRTARYQCVLAFVEPAEGQAPTVDDVTRGTFEGRVAFESRGGQGFGYDPIFEPGTEPVGGRTVGELEAAEKNAVSHRAQAARAMRERLLLKGY